MVEITEAAIQFGLKKTNDINKLINRIKKIKSITLFYEGNKIFISDDDCQKLKRNRENNIPYSIEIPEGYLTRNEAAKKYEISYNALRQQEKNGVVKIVRVQGISLLEELSIQSLKKNIEMIKLIEKDNNWIRLSSLYKKSKKYDKVSITLNRNEFKNRVIIMKYGKKIEKFIEKKLYEEIIEGKYEIINNNNEVRNILPDDINNIIDDLIKRINIYSRNEKAFLNSKVFIIDISNNIKINNEDLLYSMNKLNIKISMENGKEFIYEYDLENILQFYGYYSIKKLGKTVKIPWITLKRNFISVNVRGTFGHLEINNTLYLTLEAIEEILKEYSKKYISTLNVEKIRKERVKLFPYELPETRDLAIKFIDSKKNNYIKTHGEDTANFTRLINAIEAFIVNLDKEVFNCTSDDILNIISDKEKIKTGYLPNVCQFLNYIKKNLKDRCRFNKLFGKSVIDQYKINNDIKIEDKIYDKKTWGKYYIVLKDSNKHIEKAIDDIRYSQCWLYCILNIAVTWRKKNILLSLPRISLEEVGINKLDWFSEDNVFTLDMANSVLEQIKFSLDGIIAYKNKKNLHFNIPLSLKVPTAIAFVICELHSRKNNEEYLLYDLIKSDIRKTDYKKVFLDDELLDFQNIKCTRSIISYGYSYAINTMGMVPVAYKIYSNSRSHSDNEQRITNVTGDHYLVLDDLEGGSKEYMYHIIERGAFGFMYYKLFQCIIENEKFNSITQKDMTQLTKQSQELLNPMSLEGIANSFIEDSKINDINIFELLWHNSLNKNRRKNKKEFVDNMIDIYVIKANELFGDNNGFTKYIKYKYKNIDDSINELSINGFDMKSVLAKVANGENCCFSEYTNCIFDRFQKKENCPYKYGEKGGSSCLGCKYNLTTIYAVYEVSHMLKKLLHNIENKEILSEEEIVKNSYMVKNYLSIILEAHVHFREKEFIKNIIDLTDIKERIIQLKNMNRIINF